MFYKCKNGTNGPYSHLGGFNNYNLGSYSLMTGFKNEAHYSDGNVIGGLNNTIIGGGGGHLVCGAQNYIQSYNNIVGGYENRVRGSYSFAAGEGNMVDGSYAFASGEGNVVGEGSHGI